MMPLSTQHRKTLTFAFLSHTSSLTRTSSVTHAQYLAHFLTKTPTVMMINGREYLPDTHQLKVQTSASLKRWLGFLWSEENVSGAYLCKTHCRWFGCCDWSLEHCHAVATMFGMIVRLFLKGYIQVQRQNSPTPKCIWCSVSLTLS